MCVQGVYQSGVKVVSAPDGAVRVVEQGAEVARVIQTQSPVQVTNTPAQWAMWCAAGEGHEYLAVTPRHAYFMSWSESLKEKRSKFWAILSELADLVTTLSPRSKAHLNITCK